MSSAIQTTVSGTSPTPSSWGDFAMVLRHAAQAHTTGDPTRAHALYAHAVELNPNDARGWSGLGATAPTLDEAIICWAYALALAPDNFDAQVELDARIEERIERSKRADAAVLVALGRTLAEIGQKGEAYRLFAHATKLDPTNEEAWVWRAGLTSNLAEMISCLNQALALNPGNPRAQAGLKWAMAKKIPQGTQVSPEDVKEATRAFDQAQQALRAGKAVTAYECFKRATELHPQDASAWVWRGSTAPTTDEALMCMERALQINPTDEAVKDARWWLRVKKIRESVRPSPHPPASASPASTRAAAMHRTREEDYLVIALVVTLTMCAFVVIVGAMALRLS